MKGNDKMIFVDCLENAVATAIEKRISGLKEQKEYKKFQKEVEVWCNDYITRNETTIVANSAFSEYILNYNLIDNIFDFIECPTELSEESFMQKCYDRAVECLKEKKP